MLEEGIKAPDFTLPDQNGDTHSLSDYNGRKRKTTARSPWARSEPLIL